MPDYLSEMTGPDSKLPFYRQNLSTWTILRQVYLK